MFKNESMNPITKVYLTLFGNLFLIIITVVIFIFQFKSSTYFRFGPSSSDLIVIIKLCIIFISYSIWRYCIFIRRIALYK